MTTVDGSHRLPVRSRARTEKPMRRQFLVLESGPAEEECADVGVPDYRERALRECNALVGQLRRQFGREPPGAALAVRPMPHDAGTYYTVIVFYEGPEAEAYALRVEKDFPGRWDDQARRELGLGPEEGSGPGGPT